MILPSDGHIQLNFSSSFAVTVVPGVTPAVTTFSAFGLSSLARFASLYGFLAPLGSVFFGTAGTFSAPGSVTGDVTTPFAVRSGCATFSTCPTLMSSGSARLFQATRSR